MIKITIEGPQGAGKTLIANILLIALSGFRISDTTKIFKVRLFDDEEEFKKGKFDIAIITKQEAP